MLRMIGSAFLNSFTHAAASGSNDIVSGGHTVRSSVSTIVSSTPTMMRSRDARRSFFVMCQASVSGS